MFDNAGFRSGDDLNGNRGTLKFEFKTVAWFKSDQLRPLVPADPDLPAFSCGVVVFLYGKPVQFFGDSRSKQFAFVLGG